MAGALKTLFGALDDSFFLSSVALIFGDEEIGRQNRQLPSIVMVPRGGNYDSSGYDQNTDPADQRKEEIGQVVDLWLYAASTAPAEQGAIDHADAVETLRQLTLSAVNDQRAQIDPDGNVLYGLGWRAVSERWETLANPVNRFNRALVITFQMQITVAILTNTDRFPDATVTSILLDQKTI